VSVALSRARELGFDTVACASTAILPTPSRQRRGCRTEGLRFIPADLEQGKIINSLMLTARPHWHQRPLRRGQPPLRRDRGQIWLGVFRQCQYAPYYAEGSKVWALNPRTIRLAHPGPHRRLHGVGSC